MSDVDFTSNDLLQYLQTKYENMSDVLDILINGLGFVVSETILSESNDNYYLQCAFKQVEFADDEIVINIKGNEEMISTFCTHYLPYNIDEIKSMCEKGVA
jgi:hypothetical protein